MHKTRRFSLLFLSLCLIMCIFISGKTAQAAETNNSAECLHLLSDLGTDDLQRFIGIENLDITDQQYEIIRDFTLELTQSLTSDKEKIEAVYHWVKDTSKLAPSDTPEDEYGFVNDPYNMFKYKRGICQGFANLFRTMMTSLDIPCVIAHGYFIHDSGMREGHAWNYVFCNGSWELADAATQNLNLSLDWEKLDVDLAHHDTTFLESSLCEENGIVYGFFYGLGVVGYTGTDTTLQIPETFYGNTVVSIDGNSLRNITAEKLVLPKTVENGILFDDYGSSNLFEWTSLKEIVVDEENPAFASFSGALYDRTFSRLICVPKAIESLELKPLECLDKNALCDLHSLRYLKISEGTRQISSYAFENCPSLEQISLPASVTEIADDAFYNFQPVAIYAPEGSVAAEYAKALQWELKDPESFNKADYSALKDALSKVPASLDIYTDESVAALNQVLESLDYNCTADEQSKVDTMTANLTAALNGMTKKTVTGQDQNPNTGTGTEGNDQNPNIQTPSAPVISKVTKIKVSYKKSGKAVITWKKIKSADGYEIFRYQNKKWVKIKTVRKKTRVLLKRNAKKTYRYKIRAYKKVNGTTYYGAYSKKFKVRKKS